MLGASGGVGLAAVELGRLMGARVIACASSEEKLAVARAHGAEATLVYDPATLQGRVAPRSAAAGSTWSTTRSAATTPSRPCGRSAWRGRYLVIGFAAGDIPRLPLNLMLLKELDVQGVHWGVFVEREPEAHRANQRQLLAWVAEGTPHREGPRRLPARRLRAARHPQRREAVGKVLLRL